ncbi:uncharacterized protein MELLADRAFT_60676 [Melampsora larici-populina 98AG31]|uniref:Uncharacterized protein n=1 Tax=Melampsora larici-populina (strain 98AG31 / pathotype 3-4-7) TaxID=747676 RepID=F4RBX7_MELLP|nr:uncharacterized protein MELLADRAFT_60676 [Melampsora larici-populina 98AG31]EGG10263.1 hypothetical protein MELLADRAFT_60676 [Melampsora larici-populina 98AG31]
MALERIETTVGHIKGQEGPGYNVWRSPSIFSQTSPRRRIFDSGSAGDVSFFHSSIDDIIQQSGYDFAGTRLNGRGPETAEEPLQDKGERDCFTPPQKPSSNTFSPQFDVYEKQLTELPDGKSSLHDHLPPNSSPVEVKTFRETKIQAEGLKPSIASASSLTKDEKHASEITYTSPTTEREKLVASILIFDLPAKDQVQRNVKVKYNGKRYNTLPQADATPESDGDAQGELRKLAQNHQAQPPNAGKNIESAKDPRRTTSHKSITGDNNNKLIDESRSLQDNGKGFIRPPIIKSALPTSGSKVNSKGLQDAQRSKLKGKPTILRPLTEILPLHGDGSDLKGIEIDLEKDEAKKDSRNSDNWKAVSTPTWEVPIPHEMDNKIPTTKNKFSEISEQYFYTKDEIPQSHIGTDDEVNSTLMSMVPTVKDRSQDLGKTPNEKEQEIGISGLSETQSQNDFKIPIVKESPKITKKDYKKHKKGSKHKKGPKICHVAKGGNVESLESSKPSTLLDVTDGINSEEEQDYSELCACEFMNKVLRSDNQQTGLRMDLNMAALRYLGKLVTGLQGMMGEILQRYQVGFRDLHEGCMRTSALVQIYDEWCISKKWSTFKDHLSDPIQKVCRMLDIEEPWALFKNKKVKDWDILLHEISIVKQEPDQYRKLQWIFEEKFEKRLATFYLMSSKKLGQSSSIVDRVINEGAVMQGGKFTLPNNETIQLFENKWGEEYTNLYLTCPSSWISSLVISRLKELAMLANRPDVQKCEKVLSRHPIISHGLKLGEILVATHVGLEIHKVHYLNILFQSQRHQMEHHLIARGYIGRWSQDLPHDLRERSHMFKEYFDLMGKKVWGLEKWIENYFTNHKFKCSLCNH